MVLSENFFCLYRFYTPGKEPAQSVRFQSGQIRGILGFQSLNLIQGFLIDLLY